MVDFLTAPGSGSASARADRLPQEQPYFGCCHPSTIPVFVSPLALRGVTHTTVRQSLETSSATRVFSSLALEYW